MQTITINNTLGVSFQSLLLVTRPLIRVRAPVLPESETKRNPKKVTARKEKEGEKERA